MKRFFALGTVFVLLLALPSLGAQSGGEPTVPQNNTVTVEDNAQDVMFTILNRVAGGARESASNKGPYFDHLDIIKVVFGEETNGDFKVFLYLKSLTPPQGAPSLPGSGASRSVTFSYGAVGWQVRPGGCMGQGGGGSTVGCLLRFDPGRNWRPIMTVPMEARSSENAYVFTLDKLRVVNENQVPARYGSMLTNITASTFQYYVRTDFIGWLPTGDPTGGVFASDRAPNEGVGLPFVLAQGSQNRGDLALSTLDPIRVSNGEATTIVYKVNLANHGKKTLTVGLEAKNIPFSDWAVKVPALVRVEAGTQVTFPVVLALPFYHEHGKTFTFRVTGKAVEDSNSEASVDLGVFWTDVAQPSQHHGGHIYFHSAPAPDSQQNLFDGVWPTMLGWTNAEPTDPDPTATDGNMPSPFNECIFFGGGGGGGGGCGGAGRYRASWFLPLSPKLLLGLDFDVTKPGKAKFTIIPKVTSTEATITVQVLYCDPTRVPSGGGGGGGGGQQQPTSVTCGNSTWSYGTLLASASATGALQANQAFQFEKDLIVDVANADYIPFRHGANMAVRIRLDTNTPQNLFGSEPRPELVVKYNEPPLTLPLLEYHDPIDAAFENVGSLQLVPLSPFEKQLNPGRTAVFKFDLISSANESQDIKVEVEGINVDWAEIVSDHLFTLRAGQTRNITLAVKAPEDAGALERAELFLTAKNVDDEASVTVTRLRAEVVKEPDIPDESGDLLSLRGQASTPAAGVASALVAAVAVGLVLRRRRA